jgi:protein-L-isoaspartate(D-aspartate) O-methyltransferase
MARRTLNVVLLGFAGLVIVSGVACAMGDSKGAKEAAPAADPFEPRRLRMVATQIEARGVSDPCVLDAMRRVHRHAFVPANVRDHAYADRPLPIGHHQTISQPYIVALMTELVRPQSDTKVLEIGTGSGYQAAVLAECAGEVYTIEILPELGREAGKLLAELGYDTVHTRVGDGFDGWPEHAPFDAIVVTAAPPRIPQPLLDQLAPGGRLVIPVGEGFQNLVLVTRTESGFERRTVTPVRFVPMTGKAQRQE